MNFEISDNPLNEISSDGLLVFAFQGEGEDSPPQTLSAFKTLDKKLSGLLSKTVKIGEIILTNEHFLAKRSDLPNLGACLVDEDWSSRPLDAGNVVYSEGDFGPDSEFYYDNNNERSIEIGAREEETVRVYIEPSYIFQRQNYSELVEAYGSYDNLVVYEKEKNRGYYYDQCGSLDESVLEEGVKIDLVF